MGVIVMENKKPVIQATTVKKASNKGLLIGMVAGGLLLVLVFVSILGTTKSGKLRLVEMKPSEEISRHTNLTFVFSKDVVNEKEVGITFSEQIIKFTPSVPGKFRWVTRRELRFLPEVPFLPSTTYKAEISSRLGKSDEQYISGKRTVEFSTARFQVEGTNVNFITPQESKGVILQARLRFNYPVSPIELEKSLKLRLANTKKDLRFTLDTEENSLYITATTEPIELTSKEQEVLILIPKDFSCVNGQVGLAKDYKYQTLVGAKKPLKILKTTLQGENLKYWIAVQCSEPVDVETVASFIEIKPQVDFSAEVEKEYILIKSNQFKAGENYNLRLNSGLPSVNGLPLAKDFTAMISLKDLEPGLNFNSSGRYLNSKGYLNLGLETVNIERVNLEISRIYANNIVAFLNHLNYYGQDYCYNSQIPYFGEIVKSENIEINGLKNEVVTTPISLSQYFTKDFKGIFQVAAYNDDRRWMSDKKYIIITDLGIVGKMGKNDLMVWVNSLESLTPKEKVKISLISKNNQILAVGETNTQGIARFTGLKKQIEDFEPLIILAEDGDDFSFVQLKEGRISTTDFDVRGRENLNEGYEAFAYLDRDIFRPGDEGNLVTIIRGPGAALPPEFPVKLEIRQPDGQIFRELVSNTYKRGACEFKLEIPDYAQTGRYRGNVLVGGEAIGNFSFKVEEFMPDRIKVTTTTDREEYKAGASCQIRVEGVNLFGPPAAGRKTEVSLRLEPAEFTVPAYQSYTFGDRDRSFIAKTEDLGDSKLDANGQAVFSYRFPDKMMPPAKINAIIQATVIEDGGRAVSNYTAVDLHPYDNYIGVKPLAEYYTEIGKPFSLKYIAVDPKGNPVSNPELNAEVYRITWNSIYRRDSSGRYRYVSEEERRKIYTEKLSQEPGEQTFSYTPKDYGRYQIVITDPNTNAQASLFFYASGWGYSPWAMEDPDKIELDLEKGLYKVGDKAQLQIKAPFAGKALITVERERVYDYWIVDFKENTGVVSIPIKEEYKPNAYLSVHLIRSIESVEKHAPARAFGTIPLMVDCSNAKLGIKLATAEEIRPNQEIEVKVNVNNSSNSTYLTLAAVDEGICQLTDYSVPNPTAFFYGKRSLSIGSYDLYGLLLPEVEGMKSESSPGGDADVLEGVRKQNLNPVSLRRVKPVSLWSGIVSPDKNGNVVIKLKIPQFNGTLRLMAVAFDAHRFGAAEKKVVVRDPVVLTPTFPRFVAPNDQFTVPVSIYNGTGKAGEFKLQLTSEGPVIVKNAPQVKITLADQEEKAVNFELMAGEGMGKLRFQLEVVGNGATCKMEEELSLRPPVPLTHDIKSGSILQNKQLTFKLDDQWIPGTADYTLALSPFPTVQFARGLDYLLAYPYGCVEQTTSKLFPLLYFDQLLSAVEEGTFEGNADYYITEGIEKIEAMQLRDGSFAYWPGGNYSNEWSSVYTAHFLVEARKAGYVISDRVYNRMISYLKKTARGSENNIYRLQSKIYALYVLSLNGTPDLSTMAYWRRYAPDNITSYTRALLAAAYFYTGDRIASQGILPESFAVTVFPRETGGNFNSTLRSDAIILSVLADVDPQNPSVYKLVNRITKATKDGHWGTTQENAFALMALGKILKEKDDGEYQGEVYLGKEKIADFDSTENFVLNDPRLAEGKVTVKLVGDGECYYYLKSSGLSKRRDLPEYNKGVQVTREYLDRHGNPLNLNQIQQGDLIVARITIKPSQKDLSNLGIVDLLPAGLEIENPRLESRASIPWLTEESIRPDYMDIRDDRLILFVSLDEVKTYQFYYALRAVTCGQFILPSIKAECMYSPEISSYNSSGVIQVVRGE
jgi:hypothetical protein